MCECSPFTDHPDFGFRVCLYAKQILIFSQLKCCFQAFKQSTTNIFKCMNCNDINNNNNKIIRTSKKRTPNTFTLFFFWGRDNTFLNVKMKVLFSRLLKLMFAEKYTVHMMIWVSLAWTQLNDENMWINSIFHIFCEHVHSNFCGKHQKSIERWSPVLIKIIESKWKNETKSKVFWVLWNSSTGGKSSWNFLAKIARRWQKRDFFLHIGKCIK